MRDAMQLLEGQAYFPEAKIDKDIQKVGYIAKAKVRKIIKLS